MTNDDLPDHLYSNFVLFVKFNRYAQSTNICQTEKFQQRQKKAEQQHQRYHFLYIMNYEKGQRVFFNHPSESWIVGKVDKIEENPRAKNKTKYWCVPEEKSIKVSVANNI